MLNRFQGTGTRLGRGSKRRAAASGERLVLASLACSLAAVGTVVAWDINAADDEQSLSVDFQSVVRGLDLQGGVMLPSGSLHLVPQLQGGSSALVIWPAGVAGIASSAGGNCDSSVSDNLTHFRGKTDDDAASR